MHRIQFRSLLKEMQVMREGESQSSTGFEKENFNIMHSIRMIAEVMRLAGRDIDDSQLRSAADECGHANLRRYFGAFGRKH
jgi:hypothetical protein